MDTIKSCKRAIIQYEELGISGTPHDLEHRAMLADAQQLLKELNK
jgi:hypothetical protein